MGKGFTALLNTIFLIFLLGMTTSINSQPIEQTNLRSMAQQESQSITLEFIQDRAITTLSSIINFLKRILVLATLLFLIENLINFWVLASSYAFLDIEMPAYFKDTISNIYTLYNESIFSYIGIDV